MIVIIDYGMGNLRSVQKSLEAMGYNTLIASDPDQLKMASKVILPGVGAYEDAMKNLEEIGMDQAIKDFVQTGRPFLGICLGMQMLMSVSEENGFHKGLDLVPGQVLKLPTSVKVPHMGWNSLDFQRSIPLTNGIRDGNFLYFVHSYYVKLNNVNYSVATTDYGMNFCSIVAKDNILGVQFHPEKSSSLGQNILKNFGEMM